MLISPPVYTNSWIFKVTKFALTDFFSQYITHFTMLISNILQVNSPRISIRTIQPILMMISVMKRHDMDKRNKVRTRIIKNLGLGNLIENLFSKDVFFEKYIK